MKTGRFIVYITDFPGLPPYMHIGIESDIGNQTFPVAVKSRYIFHFDAIRNISVTAVGSGHPFQQTGVSVLYADLNEGVLNMNDRSPAVYNISVSKQKRSQCHYCNSQ